MADATTTYASDVRGGMSPGSWEVGDVGNDFAETIFFPIVSIKETGGNRIIERKRVYKEGAKLDDTGSNPKKWAVTIALYNPLKEAPVEEEPYPGLAEKLIASSAIHECGTLTLPTTGPVRARLENYDREDPLLPRDYCTLTFNWVQDNEDGQTADSFSRPAARATIAGTVERFMTLALLCGALDQNMIDLEELAGKLERLLGAPSDYADDIEDTASQMIDRCDRIKSTFLSSSDRIINPVGTIPEPTSRTSGAKTTSVLTDPQASGLSWQLTSIADLAGRARGQVNHGSARRVVARRFKDTKSLYEIAAIVDQDIAELIKLNRTLPTIRQIEPGTPVMVFG